MSEEITKRTSGIAARGITIDPFLSEKDCQELYEKWDKSWETPLEYQGGQVAITCEMVRDLGINKLVSAYGKKRAARLLEAAEKFSVL